MFGEHLYGISESMIEDGDVSAPWGNELHLLPMMTVAQAYQECDRVSREHGAPLRLHYADLGQSENLLWINGEMDGFGVYHACGDAFLGAWVWDVFNGMRVRGLIL